MLFKRIISSVSKFSSSSNFFHIRYTHSSTYKRFDELPISSLLKQKLNSLKFIYLNELQKQTFSPLVDGKNLAVRSQTGSGKTLSYLLPILQKIENQKYSINFPFIIITSTRELVEQIAFNLYRLRTSTSLEVCTVYGTLNSVEEEAAIISAGAHVLICTPSRLKSFIETGMLSLKNLQMLIVDEVDELVSRGFDEELFYILRSCEHRFQLAVFSATFPDWLKEKIFDVFDKQERPIVLDLVNQYGYQLTKTVEHFGCKVSKHPSKRVRLLSYVIEVYSTVKCIVFCSTKNEATVLQSHPMMSERSLLLHSGIPPNQRKEALNAFRKNQFNILIASDLVARGLDVEDVGVVLHYCPPLSAEQYIHRCGRAGRGGTKGVSIVLFDSSEIKLMSTIEKQLNFKFETHPTPTNEEIQNAYMDKIEEELLHPLGVDKLVFHEIASQQFELHGTRVLASILSLLEKKQHFRTWQSVLSGRYNYTPLSFVNTHNQPITSRAQLLQLLKKCIPSKLFCTIGRIALSKRGYIVDVPSEVARQVLQSPVLKEAGVYASYINQLPLIVNNEKQHRIQQSVTPEVMLQKLSKRYKSISHSAVAKRRLRKRIAVQNERLKIRRLKEERTAFWNESAK